MTYVNRYPQAALPPGEMGRLFVDAALKIMGMSSTFMTHGMNMMTLS